VRGLGSFEQAAAFAQQHGPLLGPPHVGMLWCSLRRLLLAGTFGSCDDEAPAGGRRASLPPAAMAALTQAALLTSQRGPGLPPLGATAALACLAAARRRGFEPSRLQARVLRRLKARLRDSIVGNAAAPTPRQLGDSLVALSELGWQLNGDQLRSVASAAEAAATGGVGAVTTGICSGGEAGLLLVGYARARAIAAPGDRLEGPREERLAAPLFDAFAGAIVNVGGGASRVRSSAGNSSCGDSDDGSGGGGGGTEGGSNVPPDCPPGSGGASSDAGAQADAQDDAWAAQAAAVLEALSSLPCAPNLIEAPERQAALEALLDLLQHRMRRLGGRELAAAAAALDRIGIDPWDGWAAELHTALAADGGERMQQLTGHAAVTLLCALPRLGPAPPEGLLAGLCRAASGRLQECSARQLAAAPVALLALRHRPPRYWLDAYWVAAAGADWEGVPVDEIAGMAAATAWLVRGAGGGRVCAPPAAWSSAVTAAICGGGTGWRRLSSAHRQAAETALEELGAQQVVAAAPAAAAASWPLEGAFAAAPAAAAAAAAPLAASVAVAAAASAIDGQKPRLQPVAKPIAHVDGCSHLPRPPTASAGVEQQRLAAQDLPGQPRSQGGVAVVAPL
jgi:hypothetical protein